MKRSSVFLSTALIIISVITAALVSASTAEAGSRSGSVPQVDDPNPPDQQRFYRIRIQ